MALDHRRSLKSGGHSAGGVKVMAIVAAVIVVALAAGGFAYWKYQRYLYALRMEQEEISRTLDLDTFYEGVYVDGISLGGMTADEARAAIAQSQQELLDSIGVNVRIEDAVTHFTADDMLISFDTEAVLEKAWNTGREGSRDSRYSYVKSLPEHPVELTTTMTVDPAPLEARILAIPEFYDTEPINASIISFNSDPQATVRFMYEPEVYGVKADAQSAWQAVRALVEERSWGQTVDIEMSEVTPQILLADLESQTRLISHFETSASSSSSNRLWNIDLAISHITGTVIMPGEEFSFNATTGPRTYATGYKDAGVIMSGKLEEGVAGGVCQVSGTLFNALAMADLEITRRSHHSYELSYLKRGRDATVDYPSGTDLRCKNNGKAPVYLVMYTTSDKKVVAEVYGVPLEGAASIDIEVVTLDEYPPGDPIYVADSEVPVGGAPEKTSAHNYIKCQSYKVYKDEQGKEVRREPLILDVYRAIVQEIHVNPADMPGAATPTPSPSPTPAAPAVSG